MSAPLRLVLLDVDGTLVDSQHNIVAAMEMAAEGCGLPVPSSAAVRRIIGLSLDHAMEELFPDAPLDARLLVAEGYKDAFVTLRARPEHTEWLFPGTREMLDALDAEGFLIGLATGKSRRGVDAFTERHGFQTRFVTIHTADDGPGKPHPAMGLAALANTGVTADNAVMVGDTSFDMQMARSALMGAIGVSWGNHTSDDLTAGGAHVILDTFEGLLPAVNDLTLKEKLQCESVQS